MKAVCKGAVTLLFSATFFASMPSSADAQSCSGPICSTSPPPSGSACRVYLSSDTGIGKYRPGQSEEPSGCYDPSQLYGIQGWHFYGEGGRKISRFAIEQTDEGLDFAFAGTQQNENVQGFVWLVPLPDGTEAQTVNATGCAGICRVSLGNMPPGSAFVLLGFDFERANADGTIRNLAVGPILRSPTGVGALTVDFRDAEFAYRARVNYALISSDDTTGQNSTGANYRGGGAALVGLSDMGDSVLSGFSFKFGNSGHLLEDVGLELGGLGYEVWFQGTENEADRRHPTNPFEWQVEYTILK